MILRSIDTMALHKHRKQVSLIVVCLQYYIIVISRDVPERTSSYIPAIVSYRSDFSNGLPLVLYADYYGLVFLGLLVWHTVLVRFLLYVDDSCNNMLDMKCDFYHSMKSYQCI
jgi:hypothetical protein